LISPEDAGEPPREPPPGARPGTSTFTIEGRAAPALFVLGWLATLLGVGTLFVSFQAESGPAQIITAVVALVLLSIGLVAAAGAQGIERRARGVEAYQGPSPVLVFAASVPVTILLAAVIGLVLSFVGIDLDGPAAIVAGSVMQVFVYVGLVRLLVVDARAMDWRELGFVGSSGRAVREFLLGASWAFPIVVLTAVVGAILIEIFQVEPSGPLEPAGEPVGFAANVLVAVILAPIGEELFFRGFATTAWVRAIGRRRAIVRGGLFFAFVHILTITASSPSDAAQIGLIAFVGRIPVGLFLGWLFVRRGTIWAPLGLHAAFNAILVVLAEIALNAPAGP
jgi:hypothetical protein